MLDNGGTAIAFVDESFAHKYNFKLRKLKHARTLNVVDGRRSSAGDVTHVAELHLDIQGHKEMVLAYVTKLGRYDFILGMPWLELHNPDVDWPTHSLSFNKKHCHRYCLAEGCHQLFVPGPRNLEATSEFDPELESEEVGDFISPPTSNQKRPSVPRRVGAAAFHTLAKQHGVEIFSVSIHEINTPLELYGIDLDVLDIEEGRKPTPPSNPEFQGQSDQELRHQHAADMYLNGASLDDIRIAMEDKSYIQPC